MIKKLTSDSAYLWSQPLKYEFYFLGLPEKACQGCQISKCNMQYAPQIKGFWIPDQLQLSDFMGQNAFPDVPLFSSLAPATAAAGFPPTSGSSQADNMAKHLGSLGSRADEPGALPFPGPGGAGPTSREAPGRSRPPRRRPTGRRSSSRMPPDGIVPWQYASLGTS